MDRISGTKLSCREASAAIGLLLLKNEIAGNVRILKGQLISFLGQMRLLLECFERTPLQQRMDTHKNRQ